MRSENAVEKDESMLSGGGGEREGVRVLSVKEESRESWRTRVGRVGSSSGSDSEADSDSSADEE